MSLSYLRDAIVQRLQTEVDKATNDAVNMRVHQESTSDNYALKQVDTLAAARAFAAAARVVIEEYAKMVEPEKVVDIDKPKQVKGPAYG